MRGILAATCLLMVTGCATITTGQNQPVSVETPGCQAATCKLSNDKGTWYVTNTPGSATVQRAYGDLIVTCEKGEYHSNAYPIKSSTKAMAFGNILFGGIIGAAVDAGSGAAYDYPTLITVAMICSGDPKTVVQPAPPPSDPTQATAGTVPASNYGVGTSETAGRPATGGVVKTSAAAHDIPSGGATTAQARESKYLIKAERFSRTLGCEGPTATMNVQTATAETFTIACALHDPLFVRCENGDCRELK